MSATTASRSSLLDLNQADLAHAARAYASIGWPVLPLVPREKRPANDGGLTNASTDLNQIDTWWKRWPAANIGLRTGDIFDVLDLDSREAVETLQKLILIWQLEHGSENLSYKHSGPMQGTGKGFHMLFAATGARNFANRYPGIDFRGQRGYIVAAPSIHPSGHRYQWIRDGEPPEPPGWLHQMLVPARTTEPRGIDPSDMAPILDLFTSTFRGQPLQQTGARYLTTCIFPDHDDSTPSFVLYPENNSFYCFGCTEWGDTLDLSHFVTTGQTPSDLRASRPPKQETSE